MSMHDFLAKYCYHQLQEMLLLSISFQNPWHLGRNLERTLLQLQTMLVCRQQPDRVPSEGSQHITFLSLSTVSKECISESMASGEEPQEDTSPVMDQADVMQQPVMPHFKGSQHITLLPANTNPCHLGRSLQRTLL
ncbi:uncharacterized protein LOC135097474 [Scylla paramamosain]|uniref:uncharacterized protein LOC135097474 n=1 Tax=Scylla paramamosain TaxID=85552 RepID=UPI00308386A7